MNKRIYLSSPTMHGEEMKYIEEAFATNWVAPLGKNVDEFEREVAAYLGVGHGAALVSGTAALHMAVKWFGVTQGDIVFCTDLTFAATVNPVSYEGGRQVFIDSEPGTWNMCPLALKAAFQKHPHPKAVIVVHLYGVPARIDEIKEICSEYNVPLIEDAAESMGALFQGRQTGTFGDVSILSFNGNKIITTSGGGMLLSDDPLAVEKARFWATQSREAFPYYQHEEIGYNYRMSNIVAGIGRGQLRHLDEHISKKKLIYEKYREAFVDLPIKMNPYHEDSEPIFWLSCMTIDAGYKVTPADIAGELAKVNVEARPIWKPLHLQPVFADRDFVTVAENPITDDIFARGICLPSDIKMTDEEMNMIINMVRRLFV
ncbi:MAG: DegT/DnrJ/EryC1/StrS family aminotransferase [Lachnospiraceae bacterium]|jgi:dTDP-4-amino-4,6-dideoxygalactose transaminase|nr:DegT/DnrJ/EryC1/StrS family aminotransferase [Lachnospiraceae bacterium]